jgi:serine/threonine protein kinase
VNGAEVDGRADLYSLGCVAYYLLTGKLVFEAETAIQTILQHVQQPPVPPSQRTDAALPPRLEALVLACLAKRPSERPASAADLRRALDEIDVEPWTEDHAERWWSANRN